RAGTEIERQAQRRDVPVLELDASVCALLGTEADLGQDGPGLLGLAATLPLRPGLAFLLLLGPRGPPTLGFALLYPPRLNHVEQTALGGDRILLGPGRNRSKPDHRPCRQCSENHGPCRTEAGGRCCVLMRIFVAHARTL